VYLYGPSQVWGNPTVVARAPLAQALERGAWRFWAGDGRWTASWLAARSVLQAGPHFSVHWNAHLRRFLAVCSAEDCDGVELRTAPRPEGPWSPRLVVRSPARRPPVEIVAPWFALWSGGYVTWPIAPYDFGALAHPEFARDGGRVEYVTFNRPEGRQPTTRLLEITLR